jgi:hypothetical protein
MNSFAFKKQVESTSFYSGKFLKSITFSRRNLINIKRWTHRVNLTQYLMMYVLSYKYLSNSVTLLILNINA